VRALVRQVDSLGSWPTTRLSAFVLDILQRAAEADRTAVLCAVTDTTIANMALRLPLAVFRAQLEPVFFMLYGSQHSMAAFHRVVSSMPSVLGSLASLTRDRLVEKEKELSD
jgi:hypothetical protein